MQQVTLFLFHWQGDIKLWYQYIRFCEQCNQETELSRVYGKALAVHPNETGTKEDTLQLEGILFLFFCVTALWIMAARFEFDTRKDTAAARTIFQQSIKANHGNKHLWIEVLICRIECVDTGHSEIEHQFNQEDKNLSLIPNL